jgi:hypothetical protein
MAAARIRRVAQAQQRRAEKQQRRRLRKKKAEAKRRRGRPKQKRYYAKSQFSLKRLRKLLNNIEIVIIVAVPDEPFTKGPERMYSYYRFQPLEIRLNPDGTLKGGLLTFTFAWMDWSFVRLLVAPFYKTSDEGGYLWDPVTLFLLDLVRVLLHFSSRDKLLDELHKETSLGREIATFVGIDLDHPKDPAHKVPSEMAFTHFRNRIGPVVYEAVFHIMVGLLRQLDIITFRVLAFDSMLVETWATFYGCQNAGQAGHGCQQCLHFSQCERVPYDLEGGVGHRRSKEDPNQVEALYSYKVHSGVSFEVKLGMEFPVVLLVTPGQVYDGHFFEALLEQIERYHDQVKAVFHIADGHYDDFKNYIAARRRGARPIFHYNRRNEKTDQERLEGRGYNAVGWPFAPCGIVMHPNGYDEEDKRLKFICRKECPEGHEDCPFRAKTVGCVKNVPVTEDSRLVLEIPRGTRRYKIIFALRSSVERNNDYFADNGLSRPKYHGLHNMQLNAFLTGIATLLRKLYDLIEEASQQEAEPERYPTLDLWNWPLEKAIRERWKHFHEEDELLAFPDG